MRRVPIRGQAGFLLMAALALTLTGCLVPSREAVKDPRWSTRSAEGPETGKAPDGQGLIKPFIPQETAESGEDRAVDAPPSHQPGAFPSVPSTVEPPPTASGGPPTGPAAPPVGPSLSSPAMPDMDVPPPVRYEQTPSVVPPIPERPPTAPMDSPPGMPASPVTSSPAAAPVRAPSLHAESVTVGGKDKLVKPEQVLSPEATKAIPGLREWEDQKVRSAAMKLSQDSPNAKKGKICYSAKHDEWWVILYEDTGKVYDVKQYVWNRDREKLDPHLVLKTIGKNRLEEHLSARDGDKACELFDPVR